MKTPQQTIIPWDLIAVILIAIIISIGIILTVAFAEEIEKFLFAHQVMVGVILIVGCVSSSIWYSARHTKL